MRGRGYIYSMLILFADICFTAVGGGGLAVIAAIYALSFGEWLGRKQMGAALCNPTQGRKQEKLKNCFERVKTKAELDCKYLFKGVKVYYIPSAQINAYAFGWRSIGVTDGALNLDTRTVEALIAHEYGHIVNGDAVLNMVMTVNCLGIAVILAFYQFAFLAAIYIIVLIAYLVGVMRFSFVSYFITNKITALVRWIGEFVQHSALNLCEIVIRLVGRKGELLADEYASNLGYGFYLRNFLTRFSDDRQRQNFFEVIYSTHPSNDIRIANISNALERRRDE